MQKSALFLLFLGVILASFSCKKEAPPPPAPDVFVLELKEQPATVHQEWVGNIEGANDTEIRARVKGYLLKIAYKEGSKVKTGDLLFEIDPREAQAGLTKARATYRKAGADAKRMKKLIQSGAVSRKEYDDAKEALESARGVLDQAKLNLEFTTIRSPINGIAGISHAKVGDLVGGSQESTVLTTVSQLDSVKISFAVSEQFYLERVRRKSLEDRAKEREEAGVDENRLELFLADGKPYDHKGRITLVDRQVNTTTGTITLQAFFPNPEGLLRPGLFARIRAPTREIPNAILVPQRAIRDLQGIKQVALVDAENKTSFQTIKTTNEIGSFTIVDEGLKAGDKIVVEGLQKIREGGVINPMPAPENLIPKTQEVAMSSTEDEIDFHNDSNDDSGDMPDKEPDENPEDDSIPLQEKDAAGL